MLRHKYATHTRFILHVPPLPLYHSTTLPLYHSNTTLSLFHYTTIPFYHCTYTYTVFRSIGGERLLAAAELKSRSHELGWGTEPTFTCQHSVHVFVRYVAYKLPCQLHLIPFISPQCPLYPLYPFHPLHPSYPPYTPHIPPYIPYTPHIRPQANCPTTKRSSSEN